MHVSKSEFLKLVARWDELGACSLIPADSKDFAEAVGIFSVPKDSRFDRLIVNPKAINSRMATVSESTKELAPGCMLGLLSLGAGEMYRFSADDLSDYYYTFVVSEARAQRNAFRLRLQGSEVSHLRCFKEELRNKEVLVCLKTLAMGDGLAVEIAQQSHANVLRYLCGAMRPHECLRYRQPVPRTDFVELLAIDDHVRLQRLPIADFRKQPALRDTAVFTAAAYKTVGLIQQEKKQKRNQTRGIILGADLDGLLGPVMALRDGCDFCFS